MLKRPPHQCLHITFSLSILRQSLTNNLDLDLEYQDGNFHINGYLASIENYLMTNADQFLKLSDGQCQWKC